MSMNVHGYPWISMDMRGYPWMFMGVHGYQWISMDINGFPLFSRGYVYPGRGKCLSYKGSLKGGSPSYFPGEGGNALRLEVCAIHVWSRSMDLECNFMQIQGSYIAAEANDEDKRHQTEASERPATPSR